MPDNAAATPVRAGQTADRIGYFTDAVFADVDRRSYRVAVAVSWIVVGYGAVTLSLVWWTPWVQISWFLTGAVAYLAGRIMTRRPMAPTRGEQTQ